MKQAKVSILIVTYNSGNYIENTVRSCLKQDYKNFDILILDNNSSDQTAQKIENFKNDKIRLYKSKQNLGPYNGLNFLLEKTDAKYIAIQDHDDIYHPNKLKYCTKFLEENRKYIGCGHNVLVFYEDKKNGYIFKTQQENHVMHTSLVFRNKGFKYRNTKDPFLEDLYFQKKVLSKKAIIGNINKVLSLHLIKSSKKNLSQKRGKITIKNIKKFFHIYGYSPYGVQIFIVFLIKKTFPKIFQRIETKLLDKKYGIHNMGEILKNTECQILLKSFYYTE